MLFLDHLEKNSLWVIVHTCFIPQFRPGQVAKDPARDPLQLHHFTHGKAEAEGLVQGHAWIGKRVEDRI